MTFVPVEPSHEEVIAEFQAGPWRLVALAYLFGQYRLQVWHWPEGRPWPSVVGSHF